MGTQVTITLEDKVNEKLEKIQEDFAREYNEPLSFSEVLNEILHKGLL
jgi:predicted CopG family antitoxin